MKKLLVPVLLGFAALCMAPAQAVSLAPAGFNVNVSLTSACQLTTAPGNIALSYTSLGGAANANTTFAVKCTDGLAYTFALDAANADTLGLTIPLVLRDAGDLATVAGGTQSGAGATTYMIKASVTAGQQGTCATSPAACTSSVARTLTVSY
ncbi:MAG: Spore coat [Ramlibacter sp.]|nr:Spore coat [Ramlibacter sp.]